MSSITPQTGGTLTAFFDTRHHADEAVEHLLKAGLPKSSVRLVPGYERDREDAAIDPTVRMGFFESLTEFLMPAEDRYAYAEGLSRGGFLVSVSDVPAGLHDQVLDILDKEGGAIDFDEREEGWRKAGWSGYAGDPDIAHRATMTGSGAATESAGYRAGSPAETSEIADVTSASAFGETVRDRSLNRPRVRSYVAGQPVFDTEVEVDDERELARRERRGF